VDYGQPVRFGVFLIPEATECPLQQAAVADELGFDLVGVQDHPYQRRFYDLLEGNRRIDDAAKAAGRDPRTIRRVLNAGYVDAATLVSLVVDYGMDTFLVTDDPDEMRTFASEVAPKVREEVETRRSRRTD
jgi:hypothetical protein